MGKNGTQLLRHCVHLLVHVSTDLLAVRLSGTFFPIIMHVEIIVPKRKYVWH